MSKHRIIACDPGETTGWATGVYDKEQGSLTVEMSGAAPWKEFGAWLWGTQTGKHPYSYMVYEAWRLRLTAAKALTGSDMQPSQCIGQIKAAAWWANDRPILVSQEPSIKPVIDRQMTTFGFPDYLPAVPSNGEEHARDAVRHLWYFAINKLGVKPT